MKNTLPEFILMLILALPSLAQDKGTSQIMAGYAMMPSENPLSTLWFGVAQLGWDDTRFNARRGAVFGSYKYFVSNRIALGGTTGFNPNVLRSIFWLQSLDRFDAKILTTAGEVTCSIFSRPGIQFYAMAGLGFYVMQSTVDNFSTSTQTYGPTVQITPVGIRFGKKVGVFGELGYGYKGIVNTGLSIKI
jgi:hypothetical protein